MSASALRLGELATFVAGARVVGGEAAVSDIVHDSREVAPGAAFIAVRGAKTDGHDHAAGACADGAAALIVDHELDVACPQLVVPDTRAAMASLAAAVHGRPAEAMIMVGVTGTNGKTTVTHMLESIAFAAGNRPARQAAGDYLGEGGQIRRDAIVRLGPAGRHAKACDHLIKDQDHLMLRR